jgi:trimeric autotransporter adhesin
MKSLIKLKTTTLLVIPLVLACFALLPRAQAATPELLPAPAPDGAYLGFNTAEGLNALFNVNTAVGQFNTALGFAALKFDITGAHNTAVGAQALLNNNTGSFNTAVGENALVHNTTGIQNMALGQGALANNTSGSSNTAMGFQALQANTGDGGNRNVATGYHALFRNTTGHQNTADGSSALYSNIVGSFNVAVGDQALFSLAPANPNAGNTGGNTAIGWASMGSLNSGGGNAALGLGALINITTGFDNVALGYVAGQDLTTGSNNLYITNPAVPTESDTIRIGNVVPFTDIFGFQHAAHTATYIAGIAGVTIATNSAPLAINTITGQLGLQATSSQRFKDEIKSMDKASEAILALKPITFYYKKEIDPKRTAQFGLVAEEVEKVNPDLVTRDANGEVYTVRYEAVNAMLLNEFLKEHQKVQQLEKQIEKLTAGLQKVSDQLELSKPAPRVVDSH